MSAENKNKINAELKEIKKNCAEANRDIIKQDFKVK